MFIICWGLFLGETLTIYMTVKFFLFKQNKNKNMIIKNNDKQGLFLTDITQFFFFF